MDFRQQLAHLFTKSGFIHGLSPLRPPAPAHAGQRAYESPGKLQSRKPKGKGDAKANSRSEERPYTPRQASSGGGGSACNDHAVRDRCAARNDVIAEKQRARFPAGARDTLSPATGAGCAPARTRGRNETRSQKDPALGRIEISAHLDTNSRKIRTVRILATGHRRGADGAGGKGAQRRRPAGRERGTNRKRPFDLRAAGRRPRGRTLSHAATTTQGARRTAMPTAFP